MQHCSVYKYKCFEQNLHDIRSVVTYEFMNVNNRDIHELILKQILEFMFLFVNKIMYIYIC